MAMRKDAVIQITMTKIILLILLFCLYLLDSLPLIKLLLMLFIGFILSSYVFEDLCESILVSPAFGISYIVLVSYFMSAFGMNLRYLDGVMVVSGILLILFGNPEFRWDSNYWTISLLTLAVLMEFAVKRFYFLLPDYRAADTWFHASKVRMIIDTGTIYFHNIPPYFSHSIETYPSGYHVIISWLSSGQPENIIFAMNYLRLFVWAWFPLATYLAVKVLVNKESALYASILAPFSALYYYFIQYALLPAFTNYLTFLFALFLYVRATEHKNGRYLLSAVILSITMPLIHPYQYMAFQAFAGFYTIFRKRERGSLLVFGIQLLVSAGFYYLFTPGAMAYAQNGLTLDSIYPNKDNPKFLLNILRFTFIKNGQLLLGLGFIVGFIVSLLKRDRLLPLALTVVFLFFIILDKIYWRIPIPYYGAIWNSERVFILLTPIIPIFEGAGLYYLISFLQSRFRDNIRFRSAVALGLIPLFIAPTVQPLSIEHLANESSYLLDPDIVTILEKVGSIVSHTPVATACVFDSGRWLPILTNTSIVCLAGNGGINYKSYYRLINNHTPPYLYVDSRGAAEITAYPLNVEDFYGKYHLVYFRRGIWLFNVSQPASNQDINKIWGYFIVNDSIDCSKRYSERYFVYGWVIKNYAVQKARLEGNPYIVTLSRRSTIAFIPLMNYTALHILLSVPYGKKVKFYLNGNPVGSFVSTVNYSPIWVTIRGDIIARELNFLTIEVVLDPGEALGVRYIKLGGAPNEKA